MSDTTNFKVLVPKKPIDVLPLQSINEKKIFDELMNDELLQSFFAERKTGSSAFAEDKNSFDLY